MNGKFVQGTGYGLCKEPVAGAFQLEAWANAARMRLQVITHNLLELLKAVALPPEHANAHPERLRSAVFTHVGELVHMPGVPSCESLCEGGKACSGGPVPSCATLGEQLSNGCGEAPG